MICDECKNLGPDRFRCNINKSHFKLSTNLDLSSNHTPIIINYLQKPSEIELIPTLSNNTTDWEKFKFLINQNLNCNVPLKIPEHRKFSQPNTNDSRISRSDHLQSKLIRTATQATIVLKLHITKDKTKKKSENAMAEI